MPSAAPTFIPVGRENGEMVQVAAFGATNFETVWVGSERVQVIVSREWLTVPCEGVLVLEDWLLL